MRFTSSPYLVLFVILISIGITSAFATITLADPTIITGILDMMNNKITNVGTPTLASDAATKAYVDSASGTDTLALLGCTNNQVAQFVGSAWTCVNKVSDADTLDGIDSTLFLTETEHNAIADDDTLGGLSCSSSELAKWNGASWECVTLTVRNNLITTLDNVDTVGQYTSIAIGSNNNPVISYYDATLDELKVIHCGNTTCTSGNTITTLDSTGDIGEYTSIVIGTDNNPVISYHDFTNRDLKVIVDGVVIIFN